MRRVVVAAIPKYGGDSVLLLNKASVIFANSFHFCNGSYSMEDQE